MIFLGSTHAESLPVFVQWASGRTQKRKKKTSAAKRTAKRSRVHMNDSDKERDRISEPEEGESYSV